MATARRTRDIVLLCTALVVAGAVQQGAEAFGPAAHYVVMEKVAQGLPQGSKIRQALEQNKAIAAAGASGPDIPYCQVREALGYAPWADRYHYDRVGTFAKVQLQKALASDDLKQIAWAAGWVTHLTGDMACHGIYVNPEAGVYLENAKGRGLHKELETAAEAYVWVDIGGHSQDTYSPNSLPQQFCGSGALPVSLLNDVSAQVFGRSPGGHYREWYQLFKTGLSKRVGYTYQEYPEAMKVLAASDRRARLTQATEAAVKDAIALLQAAESGNYAGFSDAWNLDAGNDGRRFGTLTVSVGTSNAIGAGTDADIYFGMTFRNGVTKEWLLDKTGYNDFERGDNDDYYLFLSDKSCDPTNVGSIHLRMGAEHGLGVAWKAAAIMIRVNGDLVFSRDINIWLNHHGDAWRSPAWNGPK
jgi:hypothetical protein